MPAVVRISGSDVRPSAAGDHFEGSTIFLADEAAASGIETGALHEQLAAALAGGRGLVWVERGGRLSVLPHTEEGRVTQAVELATGLTIAAGSVVDASNARAFAIRGEAGQPTVSLALEGAETGVLAYTAAASFEAWIRYFFPAGAGAFDGLRFRVLAPANGVAAAEFRFDPSRPFASSSRAVPTSAEAGPSSFRNRWGGVVSLAPRPPDSSYVLAYDPGRDEAYWTLDGFWDWSVEDATPEIELVPGSSGGEYVSGAASFVVRFVAGSPAFAAGFDPAAPREAAVPGSSLPLSGTAGGDEPVTTAWVYVEPPPPEGPAGLSAGYFSQPEAAALFLPEAEDDFLGPLALQAASLPPGATSPYAPAGSFPAVPYAGLEVSAGAIDLARRFETEVLTPARTQAIDALEAPPGALGLTGLTGITGPTGPTGQAIAVTPQGLLSTFSSDHSEWRSIVLAQAESGQQRVQYTNVRGKLREALLATQLFLVVTDVSKLLENCSTAYAIDAETLARLSRRGDVPEGAIAAARTLAPRRFESAEELRAALPPELAEHAALVEQEAALLEISIAGWTFDLSAAHWAKGDEPSFLILDFAEGDFETLVGDLSRWTLPAEFNQDPKAAQKRLQAIVDDAKKRAATTEPDLQPFVQTILGTGADAWNGVLYLNVAVPTKDFPPDLAALAAGLPATELRAHHLGVTLSSFDVEGGEIALADSSLFGLILYEDPADLVYKGDAYAFKVLSLKVLFTNSTIAAFSSQVELLVGRLFAELAKLTEYGAHGPNNIVLNGTLQNGAYRFVSTARDHFAIESQVVDFVEVDHAQFVTLTAETTETHVAARFLLEGSMGFKRLGEFDLFGFGPSTKVGAGGQLAFTNLMVTMEFDPRDPQKSTLTFVADQMVFDPTRSSARAASLPQRFPLQVAAMRQGGAPAPGGGPSNGGGKDRPATPADLGFIPVESPLTPGSLGPTWFGLELTLSFGSPGALASQLGFTGALLASWAPSERGYDVAVGLRLPGSSGGRKSLTIMGPLNLSIGRLTFLYDRDTSGYLLLLQNMALSFLGLRFPPGGKTNAILFGDPDPKASNTTLGWYAAYKKDPEKKDGDGAKELPWPA